MGQRAGRRPGHGGVQQNRRQSLTAPEYVEALERIEIKAKGMIFGLDLTWTLVGTGTVDLYKPSKEIMNYWGRRTVELTVVQWGSFTRSAELLSGRTSFEHCRKMLANIIRQRPDIASVAKR